MVLTSFHGDGYRGNTRILFERLCNHSELKPVWLSRNRRLVRQIKKKFGDHRAFLTHSLAGVRILAGASAVFLTHGTSDYPFMRLPRHALIIQTYHGLPTKRGEYMRPKSEKKPGPLHRKILEYRFGPITHFLSSSPLVTRLFSTRFNIPTGRFIETGYPAYDKLISDQRKRSSDSSAPDLADEPGSTTKGSAQSRSRHWSRYWPDAPSEDRLILYAPTFRRQKRTRWFPFDDLDLNAIAEFLEEKKALLALRAHPNEKTDIDHFCRISPRFVDAGHRTIDDVCNLLPAIDVIMTDYSSIYIEGLLLDIPAVFLPYDLESYERGLPLPFEQISPGPSVFSQKELLGALDKAIRRSDGYEQERTRVRDLYFSSLDGNATGRVIQFLERSLL